MTAYQDWQVTLEFVVPEGDEEGAWTDAIFEAALQFAPENVAGMVARADTQDAKAWLVFTVTNTTEGIATEIARDLQQHVSVAVFSGRGVSIVGTGAC